MKILADGTYVLDPADLRLLLARLEIVEELTRDLPEDAPVDLEALGAEVMRRVSRHG